MLTTIEGSVIGGQLSRTGKLKRVQIKTSNQIQQVKVPKILRPLLEQVLKSSTYLRLQVEIGHRKIKAVNVLVNPNDHRQLAIQRDASPVRIQICTKGACDKRGSRQICAALQAVIQEHSLQNMVSIEKVGCLKECKHAPNVRLKPSGVICHQASSSKVAQLLEPLLAPERFSLPIFGVSTLVNLAS
jgi:(2Fe-2S) ferredoxin